MDGGGKWRSVLHPEVDAFTVVMCNGRCVLFGCDYLFLIKL